MQVKNYLPALAAATLLVLGTAPAFAQAPVIFPAGVVNAADYSRDISPGAIVSIFGTGLANATLSANTLPLPTFLAATSVDVIDLANVVRPCPLYFVSSGQINLQVPYTLGPGVVTFRVHNGLGASGFAGATLVPATPKIFSLNVSGVGLAITTDLAGNSYTFTNPAKPSSSVIMYMNSMGAVDQTVVAGAAAPGTLAGSKPANVSAPVSILVDNSVPAQVTFAGLVPGMAGLYQVNFVMPVALDNGPVNIRVSVGSSTSQTSVNMPNQALGFYYAIFGGKQVAGQTLNGLAGSTSDLAIRQSDVFVWGNDGFNAWSKNTGLTSAAAAPISGLALTLKNGSATVYDNNGIEDGSAGGFYTNSNKTVSDTTVPGLLKAYSMSNYYPLVFASYVHLTQPTTITSLTGYFDEYGDANLPFDATNPYIKFRMNIWSSSAFTPIETGGYVGDVFSTDSANGSFAYSRTNFSRTSSLPSVLPSPIDRITYTLGSPLTLPAGDYWISHDVAIRNAPAASSTSKAVRGGSGDTMVFPKRMKTNVQPSGAITK